MFYIIETTYIGPNQKQDRYVDADGIEISTSPARANMSNEKRIEGWCGTTNDWCVTAHGEYATIEEAREAIAEKFGEVRKIDAPDDCLDEHVIEQYKPGKYAPMSSQATGEWAWESIKEDIRADTTDERIAELVADYEGAANSDGFTLDSSLENYMQIQRQELRDELEDA